MAISGSPKIQKKQKKNKFEKGEEVAASVVVALSSLPDGSIAGSGKVTDENISSPRKRTKDPGVRIVGGRIYDSQNGRTCHQCRQKTMDVTALCKNVRQNKPCPIQFCFKCLLNRYGEIAEEISGIDSWNCPKCRGICNCSFCMKKRGENPTGILVHTAKATGFSSVSDMLRSGLDLKKCRELKSPKASSCSRTKKASDSSSKTAVKSKEGDLRKRKRDRDYTDVAHGNTNPSSVGKEVKKRPSKLHIDSSKELDTQDTSNENSMHTYCYDHSEEVKNISKNATEKVVESTKAVSDHPPQKEKTIQKGGPKKLSKQQRLRPADKPSSAELVEEENTGMVRVKSKQQQSKKAEKPSSAELVEEENTGMVKVKSKKERSKPAEKPSSVDVVKEENIGTVKVKSLPSEKVQAVLSVHAQNDKDKPPVSVKSESLQKIIQASIQEEGADVLPPQGEEVKDVAGIEFSADDIGPALQFLEFCSAFGKVLDLKRGQPESVLRELTRGSRIERRGLYSSAAQFHVKLLDMLEDDTEEVSSVPRSSASGSLWLQQLHKCITKSPFALKELPLEYLNRGADEYSKLNPSKKLRLLNFLCDEALGTEYLRNWIDEENLKFLEKKKEHNENLVEVNKKEKDMKQKMKDEMARILLSSRDGAPISYAESQDIISRIKRKADEVHAEKLKALELKSKWKTQRSDAVRTEHIVFDKSGRVYWRLAGGSSGSRIVLQGRWLILWECVFLADVGNWDSALCQDRWFIYDDKQEKALEKYIFSLRLKQQFEIEMPLMK
ncbi:Cell division cycle-associated 7-like protein [Nymphaea thermarum]|nr:Cell division cycle-associated 7-like protein [Nymphaea thermarum]